MAQPVDDFLFSWEDVRSAEISIAIDKDKGFSETKTPQNTLPYQPKLPRLAPGSMNNLQISLQEVSSFIDLFVLLFDMYFFLF